MRFKKILLIFFSIIFLLLLAAFVVGKYYNNEVKRFIFNKLTEQITAPIKVNNVELTLFADFPNASLRFDQLTISDKFSQHQKDTLLFADKLFLSFNFWDIWNKSYKITKVSVDGGMFRLMYNQKGESNLDIWNSTSKEPDPSFKVTLKEVNLKNLLFILNQPANKQALKIFVKTGNLSGDFTENKYDLQANINARAYNYIINDINYLDQKDLVIKSTLAIDHEVKTVQLSQVKLSVNAINLLVKGLINYGDNSSININIKGDEIRILELLASLPDFSKQTLESYDADGYLDLDAQLVGPLNQQQLPIFTAVYNIDNASLTEKSSGVTLSALKLDGNYKTGFTGFDDSLSFNNLSGSFSLGSFVVKGSIANFKQPRVKGTIQGKLDLYQVGKFARLASADTLAGQLSIDANVNGNLEQTANLNAELIEQLKASGNITLQNGRFKLRGTRQAIENVSGDVTLSDNLATVKNFRFNTENSDFLVNGVIKNLIPYAFRKGQKMEIQANLNTNRLSISDFIDDNPQKGNDSWRVVFPTGIYGDLTTRINVLEYKRFVAKNLTGRIAITPTSLTAERLQFEAFNGTVTGNIDAQLEGEKLAFKNETNLMGVSLDKVFYQFEEFGQEIITSKVIKGTTDAQINLTAVFDQQLQIDPSSIVSSIKLKIKDGELSDLQVLQDLTAYLKTNITVNAFVNCEKLGTRLKKVSFSTLENTITIQNKVITIPEMLIKSSALDISVNGSHTFDNKIDYGLNFRMAEVFKKNEITEFGYIVDDKTGMRMFITVSGTTDNPIFKFDKESAAAARSQKFKDEKNTFKSILKQELGLFKKDSTLKKMKQDDKAPVRFELEFDGPNAKAKTPASEPVKPAPKEAPKTKNKPAKKEFDNKEYNLDDDL